MRLRARPRLIGLPVAAAVVYLFATNSQVVWLYLISAMILGLVACGVIGPVIVVRAARLEYTGFTRDGFHAPLAQDRAKAFVGDAIHLRFRFRGDPSRVRVGPIELTDSNRLPVEMRPGNVGELILTAHAHRRGEQRLQRVRVLSGWPLGVITVERSLSLDVGLLIHPRYLLPPGRERQGTTLGAEESARRGAGMDFLGVREYRPGDSQRQIHWPTTARRAGLMVVETALESQSPARYELVLGHGAQPEAVELGVSLAASLAAGRTAGLKPFRLALPAAGVVAQRWTDALAALARAEAVEGVSHGQLMADTRITADADGLSVETRDENLRLKPQVGLEGALAVLSEVA